MKPLMWQDEGDGNGGNCIECGEPMIWGGMTWVRHTDTQHAATRRRLKEALRFVMLTRIAVKAGHKCTIRFTDRHAWIECSCGHTGHRQTASAMARYDGHVHLYGEGGRIWIDLTDGPVGDNKCRYCGCKWHGWLLCGDMFDWSTCRCRGVKKP